MGLYFMYFMHLFVLLHVFFSIIIVKAFKVQVTGDLKQAVNHWNRTDFDRRKEFERTDRHIKVRIKSGQITAIFLIRFFFFFFSLDKVFLLLLLFYYRFCSRFSLFLYVSLVLSTYCHRYQVWIVSMKINQN